MNKLLFCLSLSFFGMSCQENQPKTNGAQAKSIKKYDKNIIFFGNSLTAGYGLPEVSSGFVALIQKRIDSLGLPYKCVNAGLSGETTAGGAARVDWILQQKVDIFVLELGGNDALRGIEPNVSIQNLQTILDKVKAKHPTAKIVLAGMQAPRNMGTAYTDAFQAIYPKLAAQNKISLIPFILEGVGGIPSLNQGDGIHPNEAGNKIILENLWKNLQKIVLP
jgi:acyl-CoA thioesterase-1